MRTLKAFAVLFFAVLLSACATGPSFTEVSASIPAMKPTDGRVYIYRNTIFGAAVRPDVVMNGEVVGESTSGGFFYVDRAAGQVTLSTSTEVEKKITFNLQPGEVRYIRVGISMGFMVGRAVLELVDNATGEREIKETKYTGRGTARSRS